MKSAKRCSPRNSGTATITFHDVIARFSEEQRMLLQEWQKELYDNVMKEVHQALVSLGPAIASSVFSLRVEEKEDQCHVYNLDTERSTESHSPGADLSNMDVFGNSLEKAQYLQDFLHRDQKENNDHISTENDVTIVTISASIKVEETADSISYQGANELQKMNHSTGHEGAVAVMPSWFKEEEGTNSAYRANHDESLILPCHTAYESEKVQFNNSAKNPIVKSSVHEHLKQQMGPKRFSCMRCEKCYTRKDHLLRHQRTHTGVRNCKCSECPKSFVDKSTLSRHMRIHTGEKPFSCTSCGKSFTDKSNFNQHLRMHKGIRPFHCTECDKVFMHKSQLKKHLHFHSKTKIPMSRVTGAVGPEGPFSMSADNSQQIAYHIQT